MRLSGLGQRKILPLRVLALWLHSWRTVTHTLFKDPALSMSSFCSQRASEVTQIVVTEITPALRIWPGVPWGIQSPLPWCLCGPSPNKCLLVIPQSSQGIRSQDWAFLCILGTHWHGLRNPAAAAWMGPFDGLAEGLSGVGWHRILPFNSTVKSPTKLTNALRKKKNHLLVWVFSLCNSLLRVSGSRIVLPQLWPYPQGSVNIG